MCLEHGEWDGDEPKCVKLHCPKPNAPENGQILGDDDSFASTIAFECNKGLLFFAFFDILTFVGDFHGVFILGLFHLAFHLSLSFCLSLSFSLNKYLLNGFSRY